MWTVLDFILPFPGSTLVSQDLVIELYIVLHSSTTWSNTEYVRVNSSTDHGIIHLKIVLQAYYSNIQFCIKFFSKAQVSLALSTKNVETKYLQGSRPHAGEVGSRMDGTQVRTQVLQGLVGVAVLGYQHGDASSCRTPQANLLVVTRRLLECLQRPLQQGWNKTADFLGNSKQCRCYLTLLLCKLLLSSFVTV